MASRKAVNAVPAQAPVPPASNPNIPVRLLRVPDAAHYMSCTYGWIETIIREKKLRAFFQGKRRLIDIRDLDDYIDKAKEDAA